jgi:hypothetical protein
MHQCWCARHKASAFDIKPSKLRRRENYLALYKYSRMSILFLAASLLCCYFPVATAPWRWLLANCNGDVAKSSKVNTLPKAKSQAKDKRAKDRQ